MKNLSLKLDCDSFKMVDLQKELFHFLSFFLLSWFMILTLYGKCLFMNTAIFSLRRQRMHNRPISTKQSEIDCIPLRRPKRSIFLGQGPVQGPREEVQGPCARATNPVNRNGCKGHLDMCKGHKKRCKGLWCVQGPHILSLYQNTNDKQYNLVQGPQLEVQGPFMCARASYFAFLPNY